MKLIKNILVLTIIFALSGCSKSIIPSKIDENTYECNFSKNKKYNLNQIWKIADNNQNISFDFSNKTIDAKHITLSTKLIISPKNYTTLSFYTNAKCQLFIDGKVTEPNKHFVVNKIIENKYNFFPTKDTINITIVLTSNNKSILFKNIRLSKFSDQEIIGLNFYAISMICLGGVLIFALFFFLLYFYSDQKNNLYLSIYLSFISILIILNIDKVNSFFLSFISTSFFERIINIAFVWGLFFLSCYFLIFEKIKTKYFNTRNFIILLLIFTFTTFLFPIQYFYILKIIELLSFVVIMIFLFQQFKNRNIVRLTIFMTGFVILSISYISFLFTSNENPYSSHIYAFGFFIYTVSQSIYLTFINNRIEKQEEKLNYKSNLENHIKTTLLKTPAYDVRFIISQIQKHLSIEKIALITNENEDYFNYLVSYLQVEPIIVNQKIDFTTPNTYFDINIVNQSIEQLDIVEKEFKEDGNLIKSIISVPIIENERIIALVYFENSSTAIDEITKEILISLKGQIKILINTAVAYFQFNQLNNYLEEQVTARTKTVEEQKQELLKQKDELNKLVDQIESKNSAILELNDELNMQLEELKTLQNQLEKENEVLQNKYRDLTNKNQILQNNIEYAQRIMRYLMKNETFFKNFQYIDIPKSIIGGDFYFSEKYDKYIVFALADCTGHGIPGALMSIFSHIEIRKTLNSEYQSNKAIKPNVILDILRQRIKERLNYSENIDIKDGLDISLCVLDTETKELEFSGAYNHLIVYQDARIIDIKGDRMPVGSYIEKFEKPFSVKRIKLNDGDKVYLPTDGYLDQFSSKNSEKYMLSRFLKLIESIVNEPLENQKEKIINNFHEWKGSYQQIDDVSAVIIQI